MNTLCHAFVLVGISLTVVLKSVIANAQGPSSQPAADDGAIQMFSAARNGDLQAARRLLASHVPANVVDQDGWSAVDTACFTHHLDVARLLLDGGGKLDIFGASALNHTSYLSEALANNPGVINQKLVGWTPLHFAAAGDAADAAKVLIDAGAVVDERANLVRNTPLQIAAEGGEVRVMKALIERGANVSLADCSGGTAMTLAIENGSLPAVRLLLGSGALKVGSAKDASTDVETAARFGRLEMVQLLLDRGGGNTSLTPALLTASGEGHAEIVRLLISRGADPNAEDPSSGGTALGAAVAGNHLRAAEALLRAGASVNSTDRTGCTPLHYAAVNESIPLVRLLLHAGASVLASDKRGHTPIDLAKGSGNAECVRLLEGETE